MIRAGLRSLAALAAVAALLALAAGCSAARPTTRTAPNPVEQAALTQARLSAMQDGVPIAADIWTQLWTPTQADERVTACVTHGSEGVVHLEPDPISRNPGQFVYSITWTDVRGSRFADPRATFGLVESCVAAYPIDFRLARVPVRDGDALYSYDLTVLRRCLTAHGQKVPRLPSRTRFENLMRASAPWNAYDLVVVRSRAAWYALSDTCPLLPASIASDLAP